MSKLKQSLQGSFLLVFLHMLGSTQRWFGGRIKGPTGSWKSMISLGITLSYCQCSDFSYSCHLFFTLMLPMTRVEEERWSVIWLISDSDGIFPEQSCWPMAWLLSNVQSLFWNWCLSSGCNRVAGSCLGSGFLLPCSNFAILQDISRNRTLLYGV